MSPGVARYVGLAGAATGVALAGTVAGLLARKSKSDHDLLLLDTPLGGIRGDSRTVLTSDGLDLHAEVDEPPGAPDPPDVTLVLVHGYALSMDSWHYQRLAVSMHRVVLYDQRSHGRSGRAPAATCTIEMLGDDLGRVIDTLAPTGRLVLAGHSMGGMTILALAKQRPELFADRVSGVCLISTCATGLGTLSLGLPLGLSRALTGASPAVLGALALAPRLVDRTRRAGASYAAVIVRRLGFGGTVSPEVVAFANEMLSSTPIDVVASFFPHFATYDRSDVLADPAWPSTTVLCGEKDLVTPIQLSRDIAELVPGSRFVEVRGAGHLVLLERPEVVSEELERLVREASK